MIDVCVIGCGDRGRVHAAEWGKRSDARVIAVCDVQTDRMEALAAATGARPYADWRQAVSHDGIQVVSVCVPTSLHAEMTCFAADEGRHVFAEKPLALTVDDGLRMLESARRNDIVYMPCFQYRDEPINRYFRDCFGAGAFGGPTTFRFSDIREVRPKTVMHSRSVNGGVLIDMACHIFDLMRWITGCEPVRIYAAGHVFGRGKQHLAGIRDLAIDEATVELTMEDGHQLQMYLNWGMPEGFPQVETEHAMLGPNLYLRRAAGSSVHRVTAAGFESLPLDPGPGTTARIDRFVRVLRGEEPADVTGADALEALRLSLAALESIETGRAVDLTAG